MDYRLAENRRMYFSRLYQLNLTHRVHPGLVYLYMPELKKHYGWSDETALWFATINGHTQNPITSMRILEAVPAIPQSEAEWKAAEAWFDQEWKLLNYDADRNKQKKDTIKGLRSYAELVKAAGTQAKLWATTKPYSQLWETATQIKSFGRLSSFSYLEYVKINGFGADCESLLFDDMSGSRSHRNGMFFLLGMDNYVWDDRQPNSHDGKYPHFQDLCSDLEGLAEAFLSEYRQQYGDNPDIGKFTMESCLCQFKNGFFSRRYPGVYVDMGWDRIKWYDERGLSKHTAVFKDIRLSKLPKWLLEECEETTIPRHLKTTQFINTGLPFRANYLFKEDER